MKITIESIGVRYVDGTVDDVPVALSITPDRTFGELREWMDKENRKASLPVPIFAIECFKAVAVIRSDGNSFLQSTDKEIRCKLERLTSNSSLTVIMQGDAND